MVEYCFILQTPENQFYGFKKVAVCAPPPLHSGHLVK